MGNPLDPIRDFQRRRIDRVGAVMLVAFAVAFAAVVLRVAQLQVRPGTELADHVSDHVSARREHAARGDLLDRRGRIIAASRGARRLIIDPTLTEPPYGQLITSIAEILGEEPATIGMRIAAATSRNAQKVAAGEKPSRYLRIGDILEPWQQQRLEALRADGMRCIQFEACQVRETNAVAGLGGIVGKVGKDESGLLGAELAWQDQLTPNAGRLRYVHDGVGEPLWARAGGHDQARPGDDVRLSIDIVLQQIAWEELGLGMEQADAAGGRIIVLDPASGEILAMADRIRDVPDLVPFTAESYGAWLKAGGSGFHPRYQTIRPDPGRLSDDPALSRSRCVEDLYEPGSTFKPFMWSVVTERGLAQPDEIIPTHNGRWTAPNGRLLEDVYPAAQLTWSDVLKHSSNIGMGQVTARLTDRQMRSDVLRFGFGRPTDIGLPGESPGIVTPASRWSTHTQISVAMGYEIGVTPIQMVRAFSVFARNGELAGTLPPVRLRAITPDELRAETRTRVLPDWVAYLTRDVMVGVAEAMDQRARRKYGDEPPLNYSMFGKSGTAKIVRPDGRGYLKRQYNSSFIAGAPLADPRIIVLVVIDDPGPERIANRSHYGSAVAGPVVRRVVRRALHYLGVPEDQVEEQAAAAGH
ncbi:MAG: penicillin-binding protein 2 [Phycisphaerales bacterium]|nr:penicillin-binding protein 2 [Phycisphaerales bacterium]